MRIGCWTLLRCWPSVCCCSHSLRLILWLQRREKQKPLSEEPVLLKAAVFLDGISWRESSLKNILLKIAFCVWHALKPDFLRRGRGYFFSKHPIVMRCRRIIPAQIVRAAVYIAALIMNHCNAGMTDLKIRAIGADRGIAHLFDFHNRLFPCFAQGHFL